MTSLFEVDQYPGMPKILFIGSGISTHTFSWMDLLKGADLNVRLFALPDGIPPKDWQFQTYITVSPAERLDPGIRYRVYPPPFPFAKVNRAWNLLADRLNFPTFFTIEKSFSKVIKQWKPNVIHTLGFDPASFFYLNFRERFSAPIIGKWVAQVRGGPDFMLNQYVPDKMEKIRHVLQECDKFIADNQPNYDFALANGLDASKLSSLGVVSGTGGMDVEKLSGMWNVLPSRRERIIVIPKTYEAPSSKALPILEAIKLAWDEIKPCEIHMLWLVQPEMRVWFQALPAEIRMSCRMHDRIPRPQVLDLMSRARVMLAPSLTDGIPNSMLEAMGLGAFPIVSPLDPVLPVVRDPQNVLFARNLYPQEIAVALARAMNDDALVDSAAQSNLQLISRIANRALIRPKLIEFYQTLV